MSDGSLTSEEINELLKGVDDTKHPVDIKNIVGEDSYEVFRSAFSGLGRSSKTVDQFIDGYLNTIEEINNSLIKFKRAVYKYNNVVSTISNKDKMPEPYLEYSEKLQSICNIIDGLIANGLEIISLGES